MSLVIEYVNIKDVAVNPWNPHGTTADEMDELIDSISSKGIVDTPLVVRFDRVCRYETPDGVVEVQPSAKFMLVDGEQRFTAAREAFMRGLLERPVIPVTVLGNLSDYDETDLAEIGEALNHRGRGSIEDVRKTGVIASWLSKKHSPAEVARLMGKDAGFVNRALDVVSKRTPAPLPNTARPVQHVDRKNLNIVLPFEDEALVEEFESLLASVELDYSVSTRGERRTAQVLEALRAYSLAQLED